MWMDASTAVVMALTVTLAFTGIVAIVIGLWTPGFITAKMEVASIYSLFSIPAMFGWALHGAARSIGFDVIDLTGAWVSYLGLGFFFYISLAVPGALGTFADAFAAVRATLRKLLSVVSDKAGHGECRVCGAALDLPPGALGARCVYCQADNLVAPTEAEARKARDGAAKGHHQVDEAMAEEGRVRAAALSNLRSSILVRAVLLPTFMLAGLTLQWGIEGHTSPFWRRASLPTRALAPTYSSPIPRDQEVRLDAFTFDNCYEGDNLCQATILVGLEKGDRIFLHGFDAPLKISMTQRRPSRWWELSWKWEPMPLGDPAPYSGWYRLRIESPRKGKWQPITVRWSVAR
jgi:LSD1 subclass zinc finger protein